MLKIFLTACVSTALVTSALAGRNSYHIPVNAPFITQTNLVYTVEVPSLVVDPEARLDSVSYSWDYERADPRNPPYRLMAQLCYNHPPYTNCSEPSGWATVQDITAFKGFPANKPFKFFINAQSDKRYVFRPGSLAPTKQLEVNVYYES